MRKHTTSLILVLAASIMVAAGLFLTLQGESSAPPPSVSTWSVDGDPGQGAAISASASPSQRQSEEPGADLDATERSEMDLDGQGIRLLVLAREGRSPLPGAQVFFMERNEARRESRSNGYAHESEAAERNGTMLIADAAGVVVLPPSREDLLVAGKLEGLYGTTNIDSGRRGRGRGGRGRRGRGQDTGERQLLLSEDQTLVIFSQGVDGRGRSGVPIGVYQGKGWDEARRIWSGSSGEEGTRELRHFQLLRRNARGENRFAAAVRAPFYDPVAVEFDGTAAPEVRAELRLPQNGVLEVAMADATGQILTAEAQVQLSVQRPEGYQPDLPLPDDFDELEDGKDWGEEAAVFPLVGVGLEFTPRCQLEDSEDWRAPSFPGPVAHTQRLRVTVALASEQAVLAGRVLRADGEPLSDGQVQVEMRSANGRVDTANIDTDERGRFEWGVEPNQPDPPYLLDFRLQGRRNRVPEGLRIDLPVLQVGKRQDLGDLRLDGMEILALGRVVDDRGEPVNGADVRLQRYEGRSLQRPEPRWQNDSMLSARTGEDGSYEIVAESPGGRLRLRATRRGHLPTESPDLQAGSAVDMVLVREAQLSGTAVVPSWLRRDVVRLQLVSRVDGDSDETGLRPSRGRARFSFGGLAPGAYDLVAELRGEERPFLRVEGLAVGPGDDSEDSRLQELDMTGLLHRYVLRFVDQAGAPLSLNGSLLGGLGQGEQPFALSLRGDNTELISSRPAIELVLLANGYLSERMTLTSGERQVPVHTGVAVQLLLPGLRAAVGGYRVQVVMAFTGETGLPGNLRGTDQSSGRRARVNANMLRGTASFDLGDSDLVGFRLPRAGQYRIDLRILNGDRRSAATTIETVEIDPTATSQRFEIAVDPEKIAALLAQIGPPR